MYISSLPCVRVKGDNSEYFRIDWYDTRLYHVLLVVQCVYGCSDERGGENRDEEEDWSEIYGRGERMEITWPCVCRLLGFYLEFEDLKVMVKHFV